MRLTAIAVAALVSSFLPMSGAGAIDVPEGMQDGQRQPPPAYRENLFDGLFADASSLSDAMRLDGVAGYVEGVSREALHRLISEEGQDWLCDVVAEGINRKRRAGANGIDILAIFRQDEALKQAVREDLKGRIREGLPGMMRHIIVDKVFGGAIGEEQVREAEALARRVTEELDVSMNERVDAIADSMYSSTLSKFEELVASQPVIGGMDITDIRGTLTRAFNMQNVAWTAASGLGGVMGDATVSGIRERITDALRGELPPELVGALEAGPRAFDEYISRAERYLPGAALENLKNSVLNRPIVKLPTPTYAAILAASAAGHFARAFGGPFVDPSELKRGVEVTRVMVWQMRNKQSINLSLMQLGGIARQVASNFGAGDAFEDIVSRLSAPLDRIQEMADRIDALVMRPIEEVRGELHGLVDEISGRLTDLQEYLVSPLGNGIGQIQGGLDGIRDSLIGALPENFNGIPPSWEDMKGNLGIEGGILGEKGDWRPTDTLGDVSEGLGLDAAARKVRRDFSEVNEKLSEHISTVAAEALEGVHLLGPAAAILDVERVPARNPSRSGELDPVLLHNGEYMTEVTDVVIPGRGLDFRFSRIYRGMSGFLGELGWRWTHSYAERILPWRNGYTHVDCRGRKFFFERKGSAFKSPPGIYSNLVKNAAGFELRHRNGNVTSFDGDGRMTKKCDRHDNCMTFEYGRSSLLSAVIDTYGRRIGIERRKDGLISRVRDFAGRSFAFQYNDEMELIGVTAPATREFKRGKTTAYRYVRGAKFDAEKHLLTMIMDPNGNVFLRNLYDLKGRVTGQRYGDGPWMTVHYEKEAEDSGQVARVEDALGTARLYEQDADGHPLKKWLIDGDGRRLLESYSYDKSGEILSACRPSGFCRKFHYDYGGLVKIEEHPSGGGASRVVKIDRESNFGRIKKIVEPDGTQTVFEYDGNFPHDPVLVKRLPRNASRWTTIVNYRFNRCGQPVAATDALGAKKSYVYYATEDPDGDGVSVDGRLMPGMAGEMDDSGNCGYLRKIEKAGAVSFTYDSIGNITSVEYPGGKRVRYYVNAVNQVIREEPEGEFPRRYHFDANDNLANFVIDGNGGPIIGEFRYDILDRPLLERRQVAHGKFIETRFEYDEAGNLIGIVHPEGNRVEFEYDSEGRPVCEIRGAASLERSKGCVKRDGDGLVIAFIDGDGLLTSYGRDGFGDVIDVRDPAGNRTKYDRDALSRITARQDYDASGKLLAESKVVYDSGENRVVVKRRLWQDDPSSSRWVESKFEYDALGNLSSVVDPTGAAMGIERDEYGRIISVADPEGVKNVFVRDVGGKVVETFIEGEGVKHRLKKYSYDGAGRVVAFNGGSKNPWRYGYDGLGNLISIENPYGEYTRLDVDGLGRVISVQKTLNDTEVIAKYEWDGNGRLKSVTDAEGKKTRFAYDALDRLVAERHPDSTERRLSYDDAGRVKGVIDRNGNVWKIGYDSAGRLSTRVVLPSRGDGKAVHQRFEHDGLGRLSSAADGDFRINMAYDSLSRPIAETSGGEWMGRRYDDANRVSALSLPGGRSFYNAYDRAGRIKSVMSRGTRIAAFEYDAAGYLVRKRLGKGLSVNIGMDLQGRISLLRYQRDVDVQIDAFETHYDDEGNVAADIGPGEIARRYWRDSRGRLVDAMDMESHSSKSEAIRRWHYDLDLLGNVKDEMGELQYDSGGNLISNGNLDFSYDAIGRLSEVKRDGRVVASFGYDAFDRRRDFIWDGWRMVADDEGTFYIYDEKSLAPFAAVDEDDTKFFILDRLDSVRGAADKDGRVISRCSYDPYGNRYDCGGRPEKFCFAGHICDEGTGLIYMRHRYYAPKIGRFLTPDPLGYKVSLKNISSMDLGPNSSYHVLQGGASRATFPNRPPNVLGDSYGVYPFDRLFFGAAEGFLPGELNPYLYAKADPTRFVDPLGLASLIFDRSDSVMYLLDGEDRIITEYLATNRAINPDADPFEVGGNGPFPDGTYSMGVPEFYSEAYREDLYRRFGLGDVLEGESLVTGDYWKRNFGDSSKYSASYGRMRLRAGSYGGGGDEMVWKRGLFVHGGRHDYRRKTLGCIRADDDELETLAANFIALRRQGDSVETITVRE